MSNTLRKPWNPPPIPQPPGNCYLCRHPLIESREAAVEMRGGKMRLVCRNRKSCSDRRELRRLEET